MKRVVLIIKILTIVFIEMMAQNNEKVTLTFSENDFSFSEKNNSIIEITSSNIPSFYLEDNGPGLPLFPMDYAIPTNLKYVNSTQKINKRLIRTNIDLATNPIQIPTTLDSLMGSSSVQKAVYKLEKYPLTNCQYISTSQWENANVLHFITCPFIYDVKERNLYFIDSINIDIVTAYSSSTTKTKHTKLETEILNSFILNSSSFSTPLNEFTTINSSNNHNIDYVIITAETLKDSFERLYRWKKTKGLYSKIITVEEIRTKYPGKTLQIQIKKCLYDLYKNYGLTYALLGGDDTIIPVQGCYGRVSSSYIDNNIPTDMFYACFGGNFEWDANNNGIYGETNDSIDLSQSIYISRAPVRTKSETNAFVEKVLLYEKQPIWNNNILMCGTNLFDTERSNPSDAEMKGDILYNEFIKPYWSGKRIKFFDTYTDITGDGNYNLSAENLKKELSKGYNFMDIMTHGSQTSWQMETGMSYLNSDGLSQSNSGNTIITTMACSTNAFDSSSNDPCLSESLIRNPSSGVIAYLGCSRYGWGSYGQFLGTSLQYESFFYKNLFSNEFSAKNYGVLVAATKSAMISNSLLYGSCRWVQFGLNPIGDPEMPIYTSFPRPFTKFSTTDCIGSLSVSTGLTGCRICIMSMDDYGESYYKVYEDAANVTITDAPLNCSICVTKQKYIPSIYTICHIQNETLNSNRTYNCDLMKIGSSVSSSSDFGPVTIKEGILTINADLVILDSGTRIEKGAIIRINKLN